VFLLTVAVVGVVETEFDAVPVGDCWSPCLVVGCSLLIVVICVGCWPPGLVAVL